MPSAAGRLPFLTALLVCIAALSAAWLLQMRAYLAPCALCHTQRLLFTCLAMVCMAVAVCARRPAVVRGGAGVAVVLALAGSAAALRQLWWQFSQEPAQTLDYLNAENRNHIVMAGSWARPYLFGTPDCGVVNWSLLGLSLPEWSLLGFCCVLVLMLFPLLRR